MCCFPSHRSARENSTNATRPGRPVSMVGMFSELVSRNERFEIESVCFCSNMLEVSANPLNFRMRQPVTRSSQLSKLRMTNY